MTPEQRKTLIGLLQAEEEISPEWSRILFPPEKREYELTYYGKAREEDIIADTLAVPLQPVRTFGKNGIDWHNMLIFGDNLQVMKSLLDMKRNGRLCNSDGTPGVRLVYIDPPFATKKDFQGSQDEKAYQDKIAGSDFLEFLRRRLILIRELLSDDGTLYLHLDWRKVHYIKVLCDEIFTEKRFRNEVIWYYRRWSSSGDQFQRQHESLLIYSRTNKPIFNTLYESYTEGTLKRWKGIKRKTSIAEDGKLIQVEDEEGPEGANMGDVWPISIINANAIERTGYPTQKPEELLRRIVLASSNEGDIILDSFSGSGTSLAVSEKLNRRWIGIDCGKLAIYSIQKRLLNIRKEIGNKGPHITPKPFSLYNAGLYDFSQLKKLPWQDWRFFALQLFQCRDEPHKIGGIEFDGYRQGASVLVFNHIITKHKDARVSIETIQEIHEAVGSRIGSKVFIIAPALSFDFQQDYIDISKVRYYALRIPYSIIHELHRKEFTALKQPSDELAVNDTVDAVGFDFIRTPELKYKVGIESLKKEKYAYIKIEKFISDAVVREPIKKRGNLETLSMVMLDYDYNEKNKIFDLDYAQYADTIEKDGWKVRFPLAHLGNKFMAVFLDIYGNEARVLINSSEFKKKKKSTKKK